MTRRDDDSLVSVDELVAVLHEHEGPPQPMANGRSKQSNPPGRRRARQAALLGAAVAIALLVGSALGFGLGSSVTPSSSASSAVVGYGFLPAQSWNVMQSGAVSPASEGRAVAANVPLRETGPLEAVPYATLESIPRGGIVIFATFGLRGDPGEDYKFPVRHLPLRLTQGHPVSAENEGLLPSRALTQYRIRAGVGGSNVDVRIYFGSPRPSASLVVAAERQLQRLVVASERVTIAARPTIAAADRPVTLFGSVDNGKSGEAVEIQSKDCGQSFFRGLTGATTGDGGGWSTEYWPAITTTVRAVWNGSASSQITVRKRTMVNLTRKASSRTRYTVWIVARASFWRKRVLIQQRDKRLGRWKTIESVVLTEQNARGGNFVGFSADYRVTVAPGSTLRAFVPANQARPCYLSGTSLPVRT